MNDVTYVEAARRLAERMMREGGATPEDARRARPSAWRRAPHAGAEELDGAAWTACAQPPATASATDREGGARSCSASGESPARRDASTSRNWPPTPTVGQPDPEPGRDDHEGMSAMDPRLERELLLTRRQFFGTAAPASARRRWRRCWPRAAGAGRREAAPRNRRTAGPAALRAEGEAGHLPVPVRRAVAARPVRPQAGARGAARQGAARLDPQGPAAHRHDRRRRTSFPVAPVDVQVRAARPERRVGQRAAAAHRRGSPTTCASSGRCTPRRSTTTRRSRSSRPAPSWPAGRASARGSATGWAARTSDLPAFVVMISHGTGNPATSRSTTGCGAAASCRRSYQGVKFRAGGDPVLYLSNPAGHRRRDAPAACSTTSPS